MKEKESPLLEFSPSKCTEGPWRSSRRRRWWGGRSGCPVETILNSLDRPGWGRLWGYYVRSQLSSEVLQTDGRMSPHRMGQVCKGRNFWLWFENLFIFFPSDLRAEHNNRPDAVQHVAVRKHPHIQVGLNYVVELPVLLIPEKCIRHPDLQTKQSWNNTNCIALPPSLSPCPFLSWWDSGSSPRYCWMPACYHSTVAWE